GRLELNPEFDRTRVGISYGGRRFGQLKQARRRCGGRGAWRGRRRWVRVRPGTRPERVRVGCLVVLWTQTCHANVRVQVCRRMRASGPEDALAVAASVGL